MKVLLVEDSRAIAAFVEGLLRDEPDLELLPTAPDGWSGVASAVVDAPDVVLMDLELPGLDGIGAIERIMAESPRPIVVFSSHLDARDRDRTFESLRAGAVEVMAKPESLERDAVEAFRHRLVGTLRLMAQAHVVNRRLARRAAPPPVAAEPPALAPQPLDLVVIGCSTGGPPLLFELLRAVPAPYPLPIAIAQHVMPGFETGLARWLATSGHAVAVARDGEPLQAGRVLLAPADRHLSVSDGCGRLLPGPGGEAGPVPSADVLFASAAQGFGSRVVGLLLSGMGDDGAQGLAALRRAGALTATQRADTCVIDGMPAAARALGAPLLDLAPPELAGLLLRVAESRGAEARPPGHTAARGAPAAS